MLQIQTLSRRLMWHLLQSGKILLMYCCCTCGLRSNMTCGEEELQKHTPCAYQRQKNAFPNNFCMNTDHAVVPQSADTFIPSRRLQSIRIQMNFALSVSN